MKWFYDTLEMGEWNDTKKPHLVQYGSFKNPFSFLIFESETGKKILNSVFISLETLK